MDKEISKLERTLFHKIANRLRSYSRSTNEPRFEKYKRLWHDECLKYSRWNSTDNPGVFKEVILQKLSKEIEDVRNLPKKVFTGKFGPKRVWSTKKMTPGDWLNYNRTKRNEKRSKELHKPTI